MISRRYILICQLLLSTVFLKGQSTDWPLFRGTSDLSGRTEWALPENPQLLWTFNSGSRSKSSPVISEGVIYFGTDAGSLVAVTSDGKLKWKSGAGSRIEAPPAITGAYLIYSTIDGTVKAADKTTGKIMWNFKTGNQIAGSANIWQASGRSGVIVGSYDFYLYCINLQNGSLQWKIETDNYVNGTPAVVPGKIVFGGCDGVVRVVDPARGKEIRNITAGVYIAASPAVSSQYAYVGDYEGNLYKIDINTGKIVWDRKAGDEGGSILSAPSVNRERVYVGSDDCHMYCFDLETGNILWKYRTNDGIAGSPVLSGNRLLFGSKDGYVYILDSTSGLKKWSFNCGSPVYSTPAVTKERFYILTEDGRLLAFGIKKQ